MKWLFLFLLLLNASFALWGQYGRKSAPDLLARQQIHPEMIRIAAPEKPHPVPVLSCYRWGTFSGNIDSAKGALSKIAPQAKAAENILKKPEGYWAYVPPSKTKAEALLEIRKLNGLGIRDHFLIQESGKWQYAISLGIFKTQDAARKYAARMRAVGEKMAESGMRDPGQSELLIQGLSESDASRIGSLDFKDARIVETDCSSFREKASRD